MLAGSTAATYPFHCAAVLPPSLMLDYGRKWGTDRQMTNALRGYWCRRRVVSAQNQLLAGSFATVLTMQAAEWHCSGALQSHSLVFLKWYQHKAAASLWRFRPSMNNGTGLVTLLCAKRTLPENSPPAAYLHHIQLYRHLSKINISV